jgi:cell division septation protein DedD
MKKGIILAISACMALAFTSCKSSESAYKKAYEKAKQQELVQQPVQTETAVASPVAAPRVERTTPVDLDGVRRERIQVVSGVDNLKDYSVVCGSFGIKANAVSLRDYLKNQGYQAVVAFAPDTDQGPMYRVIIASYADRSSAADARDAFKAKYPGRTDFQGSWLLLRVK